MWSLLLAAVAAATAAKQLRLPWPLRPCVSSPLRGDDITKVMVSIHQHQMLTSDPFVCITEGKSQAKGLNEIGYSLNL